jgi:hypothetical protein
MYRKGGAESETNIKNVGLEKDFYGKEGEHSLDDQITALETPFALLLDDLRSLSNNTGPLVEPLIPSLIAHLCIRTRQVRQSVLDAMTVMVNTVRDHLSDRATLIAGIVSELESNTPFRERIRGVLMEQGLSSEQAELILPHVKTLLPELMDQMPELKSLLNGSIRHGSIAFASGVQSWLY